MGKHTNGGIEEHLEEEWARKIILDTSSSTRKRLKAQEGKKAEMKEPLNRSTERWMKAEGK